MSYKRAVYRQAQRAARRDPHHPAVMEITVWHDEDCAHWHGGECDCDAIVGPARGMFVNGGQAADLHRQTLRRRGM